MSEDDWPDIRSVPRDLCPPGIRDSAPAPGCRVRQVPAAYLGTEVYHTLYLPVDWQEGKRYPLIVEYPGNGPYTNALGDVCTGPVEDCNLGYGISGGEGFIWACLPIISPDHERNQLTWWGDIRATVDYCRDAVGRICGEYGGDPSAVFISGFSRGAIAGNYVGPHDDGIARIWLGFVAHSHYDGVRAWGYPGDDRRSALGRLERLRGRAQFISHEGSVEETRAFLAQVAPDGPFTFQSLPYRNHTDTWVLCDLPERRRLRSWVQHVLDARPVAD